MPNNIKNPYKLIHNQPIGKIYHLLLYKRCTLISSADISRRYAGGTSNTV